MVAVTDARPEWKRTRSSSFPTEKLVGCSRDIERCGNEQVGNRSHADVLIKKKLDWN
jgi:hypothetical protein